MVSSTKGLVGCGIMTAVQAEEIHMGRVRQRKLGAKLLLFKQLIPFTKKYLILGD